MCDAGSDVWRRKADVRWLPFPLGRASPPPLSRLAASAEPAAAPLRETSVDQMEAQLLKFMMEARPSGEDQGEWAGKMRRTIERVSKEKNKKVRTARFGCLNGGEEC